MTERIANRIAQHFGTFEYASKKISFNYWSNLQDGQPPDTIIFLGTGQTGRIARWAAQAAPSGVVVVLPMPLKNIKHFLNIY